MQEQDQDWLAAIDVMEILSISRTTLSKRVQSGLIRWRYRWPGSKYRLYHRGDVEALLADSRQVRGGRGG